MPEKQYCVFIKLPPAGGSISAAASKALGTSETNIKEIKILKRSIDARHTPMWVYKLAVTLMTDIHTAAPLYTPPQPLMIPTVKSTHRPVIAGLGPAGLFCGLILARAGLCPILLERGMDVDTRRHHVRQFMEGGRLTPDSNVQFGEGGAGTFSDGKIGTGVKSPLIQFILQTFIAHGAPPEIAYDAHPHIGSDRLPLVVKSIREEIKSLGGTVYFGTTLSDISVRNGAVCAAHTEKQSFETDALLLAVGHSARDTFSMLYKKGVHMEAKPFAIGARIEHPRSEIDAAIYKSAAPLLPAADYRLVCHLENGRSVYSFCMCPGGYVIPAASEQGGVVTNGFSLYARDGENSNSALLVGISPKDFGEHVFDGVNLQREIEKAAFLAGGSTYKAPCQRVGDFLENHPTKSFGKVKPTYARGVIPSDIGCCLPTFITDALRLALPVFAKKLPPFGMADALLTAPETRSSSPLRMLRNQHGESNIGGLFPAGEGSGYAGGIMSAAIDGIRSAFSIIERLT